MLAGEIVGSGTRRRKEKKGNTMCNTNPISPKDEKMD